MDYRFIFLGIVLALIATLYFGLFLFPIAIGVYIAFYTDTKFDDDNFRYKAHTKRVYNSLAYGFIPTTTLLELYAYYF